MSASLRERVEAAVTEELRDWQVPHPELMAADVVRVTFEAMADARPCVTCGKGIGPAKVAKGYVQCYDCTRKRPV